MENISILYNDKLFNFPIIKNLKVNQIIVDTTPLSDNFYFLGNEVQTRVLHSVDVVIFENCIDVDLVFYKDNNFETKKISNLRSIRYNFIENIFTFYYCNENYDTSNIELECVNKLIIIFNKKVI